MIERVTAEDILRLAHRADMTGDPDLARHLYEFAAEEFELTPQRYIYWIDKEKATLLQRGVEHARQTMLTEF